MNGTHVLPRTPPGLTLGLSMNTWTHLHAGVIGARVTFFSFAIYIQRSFPAPWLHISVFRSLSFKDYAISISLRLQSWLTTIFPIVKYLDFFPHFFPRVK